MSAANSPHPARSIGEATTEVVIHAFDLVETQIPNLPNLLQQSLNNPAVKVAMEKTLNAYLTKQMNAGQGMHHLTSDEARSLAGGIAGAAGAQMEDAALKHVQNSPEYRALQQSVQDFEAAARSMAPTVWLDKAGKRVYVSGTVLKIAGVAFLYVAKVNSKVTDMLIKQLVLGKSKVIPVGNLKVQGQLLVFNPATQSIGGQMSTVGTIESVRVTTTLGVVTSHASVQNINGSAVVKFADWTVTGSATDPLAGKNQKVNLALSASYASGMFSMKFGVSSQNGQPTGTIGASYGNLDLTGKASGKEQSIMLTFKVMSF